MRNTSTVPPLRSNPVSRGSEILFIGPMRDHRSSDIECLDELLPRRPIEVEDGLMLLDALFFDLGDFAGLRRIYFRAARNLVSLTNYHDDGENRSSLRKKMWKG